MNNPSHPKWMRPYPNHKNARTTAYNRELMVKRVLKDKVRVSEVARQSGVNRHTVYKWLARYKQGGLAALHNRSSKPLCCPRRMPVEQVATIAAMRRMRVSRPAIAYSLSLPSSTIGYELRRLGLSRLSRLKETVPLVRYEHKASGDTVHLDINKLRKINGLRSGKRRKPGCEYLYVCVDGNSRTAYTEMLPDEKAISATCFLIRAEAWFKKHGAAISRAMTDYGSCYRSHLFKTAVAHINAKHATTRPYTPRTKTARLNASSQHIQNGCGLTSTSIKEWAYSQAYETSEKRIEHLRPWTDFYNQKRPHTALKYKSPISRLTKCEQPH